MRSFLHLLSDERHCFFERISFSRCAVVQMGAHKHGTPSRDSNGVRRRGYALISNSMVRRPARALTSRVSSSVPTYGPVSAIGADDLPTLVMSARGTHAVGKNGGRTVRTNAEVRGGHLVVIGAAHVALAAGGASFGLSHVATPYSLVAPSGHGVGKASDREACRPNFPWNFRLRGAEG